MTAVGLVPHPHRPASAELARTVAARLEERGAEVRLLHGDADAVGLNGHGVPSDAFAPGLDFAISLGGDGTMLRTVDAVHLEQVPVLGVNLGQLGFLAGVEAADLLAALDRVVDGAYEVEERMVLRVSVSSGGSAAGTWTALNECLLEKKHSGRLVRLGVSIGGESFTTYAADGIIVSTPTGSTAYAFSARGPIISPALRCLLLTPVSPHMLFDRSLVLAPEEQLKFEVAADPEVELTIDGRTLGTLERGDTVECRPGEWPAKLIVFDRRSFHQVLKAKFQLPDRSA